MSNHDTTTAQPHQATPTTAKDAVQKHRAQLLAARLAEGPALLELDDAIEILWHYQNRIGKWNGIGDDDHNEQLLRLAKDADLFAGICRAIVAGEELFCSDDNRAARATAKEQAGQNPPPLHA